MEQQPLSEKPGQGVRLDRWLWAARFFKTRGLAQEAIKGGHVHLNGTRIKPSRTVRAGDRVEITKGRYSFDVRILGLSARRGPASVAATLYVESEESIARREAIREQRALERSRAAERPRRPDKRARRKIIRFTRKRDS